MRALLVALFLGASSVAQAEDLIPGLIQGDPVKEIFGCTENPCVITKNNGGGIRAFEAAADELLARRWTLVIDGDCYSACVVAADILRRHARVCITERASFHFHQAFDEKVVKIVGDIEIRRASNYVNPPHELDLAKWNMDRGGYPKYSFNRMSYAEARKFWDTCVLNPPLPRPRPASLP